MKRLALALVIAAGAIFPAAAEEANAVGVGYMQCTQLSEMYKNAPPTYGNQVIDVMVGSWAGGFMTATNMMLSIGHQDTKNLAAVPLDQQIIRIRKYCKQHPDEKVMSGVSTLFGTLPSLADGQ